jgi:hypothetical protein
MSSLQKLFISPMNSVSCRHCGNSVSIAWKHAIWLFIPLVLTLVILKLLALGVLFILLAGLAGAIVISVAQVKFVPLSRDQVKTGL